MKETKKIRLKPGQPKREHILSTALDVVSEHGGQALNMKDLSKQANVPRTTLYRYYSSKEHLISDLALHWGMDLVERLHARPPRGKTIGKRITGVFKSILQEASDHPKLIAITLEALVSDNSEAKAMQDPLSELLPAVMSVSINPEEVPISQPVMDVMLRLLLANLQLMSAGRSDLKEALENMTFAASSLLDDEVWEREA